jgi:hypothetical protein
VPVLQEFNIFRCISGEVVGKICRTVAGIFDQLVDFVIFTPSTIL